MLQLQEHSATPSPNAKGTGENEAPAESTPEPRWYDVDILKTTQYTVTAYQVPVEENGQSKVSVWPIAWGQVADGLYFSPLQLEDVKTARVELQPGKGFRFRVCGINSCGRGPFSEVAVFKTCMPGYPGAPSAIRISKVGSRTEL